MDLTGAHLQTFRTDQVRGRQVPVATARPFYIERSLGTLSWLLSELAKDAAVGELTGKRTHAQEQTMCDEIAAVECNNDASFRQARSKRAYVASRWINAERAVALFTVRRRACRRDADLEADVHRLFGRAKHWAAVGETLPNALISNVWTKRSNRRRRSAYPSAAQAGRTSGESEGSRSDVEDGASRRRRMHPVTPFD